MKRMMMYAAALLVLCGMTGCGASKIEHDAVYTDVNPFNSDEIRYITEKDVDADPPEEWLYTEIAYDDSKDAYLRYITKTETVGSAETELTTNEDGEYPVEIDVFDGAKISVENSDYPKRIKVEFESSIDIIDYKYQFIKATPSTLVVRVIADEKANALKENNYKLKEVSKDYEFDLSEMPHHTLIRNEDITPEIEEELIAGMTAAITENFKSDQIPDVKPVAIYTFFPEENTDYAIVGGVGETAFSDSNMKYDGITLGVGNHCNIYGILKDDQGVYYFVRTGSTEFDSNGDWNAEDVQYLLDYDIMEQYSTGLWGSKDYETAYQRLMAWNEYVKENDKEGNVLTEFKTYTDTDTAAEQPETTEAGTESSTSEE